MAGKVRVGKLLLPGRVSASIAAALLASGAAHSAASPSPAPQRGDAERCAALTGMDLGPDTRVTSAAIVQPPFSGPPQGPRAAVMPAGGPTTKPFCRVEVTATPGYSDIRYEAWLPLSRDWNGRFFGVGAGGYSGDILYSTRRNFAQGGLTGAVSAGYAAMATDYGHRSQGGDLMWAAGHPEQVADFGYRAVHVATTGAKRIASEFYGRKPNYSYWDGCSRGGAMALVNAQRWYKDYDGIVAGNPARDWIRALTSMSAFTLRQVRDPAARIPMAKRPFIHAAVVGQCDALDGVQDGIISRADLCKVDTRKLVCTAGDREDCLTGGQAAALGEMYAGLRRRDGSRLADGYLPGAEGNFAFLGATDLSLNAVGSPRSAAQFWAAFVYEDPAYVAGKSIDLEQAYDLAVKKLGWALSYNNPDLTPFKRAGGKMIMYYGANDPAASPALGTEYYEDVVKTMGQKSADEFLRYYLAPGVGHCSGGDGADVFDMLKPLQDWVEKGVEPTRVTASKFDKDRQLLLTRPLCPYPLVATYTGRGDTKAAENFTCTKA